MAQHAPRFLHYVLSPLLYLIELGTDGTGGCPVGIIAVADKKAMCRRDIQALGNLFCTLLGWFESAQLWGGDHKIKHICVQPKSKKFLIYKTIVRIDHHTQMAIATLR